MQKDLFENNLIIKSQNNNKISNKQKDIKEKIIRKFRENVVGLCPPKNNTKHDGMLGHWLEKKLGKKPDSDNNADFWGYECKNHSKSKTTWGDWSANYYIFEDKNFNLNKDEFIKIFGKFNKEKNRYSWSGSHVPSKCGYITPFGQSLKIDINKDISIHYNYNRDMRGYKSSLIPDNLKKEDLLLLKWVGLEKNNSLEKNSSKKLKDSLEAKVEKKFNQYGWFKCILEDKKYSKIVFGDPIDINDWLKYVKNGDIFFDSGMKQEESRKYSHWRSKNSFWDKLVKEEFF